MKKNDESEVYYYIATYPEFYDDQVGYNDYMAAYSLYFNLKRNDFQIVTVNMRQQFESENNVVFKENEKKLLKRK